MRYLKKFLIVCLGISMFIGIFSNIFFPLNVSYTIIVSSICLIIGVCWSRFKNKVKSLPQNRVSLIIYGILFSILIIQILILTFFPATVYHDPFRVLHEAELLSHNHPDWDNSTYFWRYSNNVPLAFFISLWLKITNVFQLSTNCSVHILSLIFLDSFIILSLRTCQNFGKQSYQVLGLALFFLVSPFSYTYYLQVFYSDLPILLILLLIFNLLAYWPKKKGLQLINIFFLFSIVLIGQLIKANLIILSIAILILIGELYLHKKTILKKLILPLTVILLALGASFPVKQTINTVTGFKTNNQYQFPLTSWIYMSYNSKNYGMYNSDDVNKMINLPSKKARQSYLIKALPARLSQLGVIGILRQWIEKVGVLLNVSNLQTFYTGGFIQTPKFYIIWKQPVHILSQAIMRSGFICLYMATLTKCLILFKRQAEIEPLQELAIILSFGYIVSLMLFWEVESRYGQALFPLLLIIDTLPIGNKKTAVNITRALHARIKTVIVCLFLIITNIIESPGSKQIIAAQRSQLSLQYHAQESHLSPNNSLLQKVVFNHEVNTFSVVVPANTKLIGKLVNLQTRQEYPLKYVAKKGSYSLSYSGSLSAGSYQLILENKKKRSQPVELTRTVNYYLAPYPVVIGNNTREFESTIYKAIYYK